MRAAHARYFAEREADILALWDSPRQREAYEWFTVELANLRAGFRCAADNGDLDSAAVIATYGAFVGGVWLGIYEPIAWAEELIEPARKVDHPRLQFLYVMASLCWQPGRIQEALRYSEAGQAVLNSGRGEVPFGVGGFLGGAYLPAGQPERYVETARTYLAGGRGKHNTVARATYVMALTARVIRRGRRRGDRVDRCRRSRPQSVCALIGAARLWLRLLGSRPCPRTRRFSPGLGNSPRQRRPHERSHTWR